MSMPQIYKNQWMLLWMIAFLLFCGIFEYESRLCIQERNNKTIEELKFQIKFLTLDKASKDEIMKSAFKGIKGKK